MNALGRLLIISGLVLAGLGILILVVGKLGSFPRLPGDILIRRGNFTFYFPIVTCILISIILTLLFSLGGRR